MVSNVTTSPVAATTNKLSIPDLLALGCAIIMLIAFAALPWMSNHTENSATKTGLSLLGTSAGQLQVENTTGANGQEIPQAVLELFSAAISRVFLIPLAALVGGAASLWALLKAKDRSKAMVATLVAGVIGLSYFI